MDPSPQAELTDDQKVLEMDIRTGSLVDLAAWCRTLGLPEGGAKEELASRLRTYFKLPTPGAQKDAEKAVVIESARGSEYFTIETVDEDYARLTGDVVVSFTDKGATHRIRANEILYNRTRNILTATGKVEYKKESGDSTETFKGESLTVDVDNWSGLFLGGASEKGKKTDETTYRFKADSISRSDEGVSVLSHARIENAATEEPYWSLTASKIWLLPGSDWAIKNALLRVGEVPLLYIPFLYLPGEKIFFHPVFGYRSREGSFLQTTTYLLGQPKVDTESESSIMKMIATDDDMELKREGLYLRRTTTKKKSDAETSLSLLFDLYSNLGSYLGVEATIPKKSAFGAITFSGGIALSRNIYLLDDGTYSPFIDGETGGDWNSSQLFHWKVPVRYRFKSTGSYSGSNATLTWSLPFYSDPYVDDDFLNRAESMDWFNLVKSGADSSDDDDDDDVLSNYEWRLSGTFKPEWKFLDPWVNSFSISSASTSLYFKYKADSRSTSDWDPVEAKTISPERYFFHPYTFTMLSLSAAIAGKPLSLGTTTTVDTKTASSSLPPLLSPRSPWEEPSGAVDAAEKAAAPLPALDLSPPTLAQTFEVAAQGSGSKLDLTYSLTPSFSSVLTFDDDNWKQASDVDWNDYESILNVGKLTGSLVTKVSSPMDKNSATFTLSGTGAWQDRTFMDTDAALYNTVLERDAVHLADYKATYFTTSGNMVLSTKPLYGSSVFGTSTLSYTLASLLAKSTVEVDDTTNATTSWDTAEKVIDTFQWDEDYLTTHSIAMNLNASVRDFMQNLTVSANLPPEDSSLTTSATMRAWVTTTTASLELTELEDDPVFEPLTVTETVKLSDTSQLYQSFIWEPEDEKFTSAVTTLKLGDFTSTFTSSENYGYQLMSGSGWVKYGEEKFRPKSLALTYSKTKDISSFWKNRCKLSFTATSTLSADLLKYTQSSFTFNLATTLKVNDFVDLTFSTKSQNSLIFRYVQDWPIFDLQYTDGTSIEVPGEKNVFVDLANSLKLWDTEARYESGFKLKSLSLSLKHYLGDWTATLSYTATPYLDTTSSPYTYQLNNEVSFLMQWIPVTEFKANVASDKDGFEFVEDTE